MKEYNINGKTLIFKPHEFEGLKSVEYYENQIISALSKIGVLKDYIEIEYDDDFAQVLWVINGKEFIFRCKSQKNAEKNLGAIAQAIQEDIRQITRGIKDLFTIMNQYESKLKKTKKKKNLFDFGESKDSSEVFSINNIKSDSIVNEELDSKFEYLSKLTNDKLDLYYFKFKEECIKNNNNSHPMLKALKIIRYRRNLKL
ncbi:MAG: hypothetical protein PF569_03565 [Candidatus Woesearchaeota archaeon]|jgi:hypothetical protein|nr:hypothetical protein [Candidatus Woesearchaeota archaeon]